jgi:uncharacterized membrane protein YagU involved in acid resistance
MPTSNSASSSSSGHALADLMIGAAAGVAAVWLMDRVDNFNFRHEAAAARQRTRAVRPDGLSPAQVMVEQIAGLAGRSPSRERIDRIGQGAHYAIGAAPAMLYSLLGARHPMITRGRGAVFGLAMFALQDELMNPLMGWSAKPTAYPWQAHARGLVGHLVYGLAVDAAVRAMKRRRDNDSDHVSRRLDASHRPALVERDEVVHGANDAVVAPLHAAPPRPSTGAAGTPLR